MACDEVSISDGSLDAVTISDAGSFASYRIPIADLTGAGEGAYATLQGMYGLMQYTKITATGHGLSNADEGKPLSGSVILNDTLTTHFPTGILYDNVDVNTLVVAGPGTIITIANSLLQGGSGYSIATSGRYVFWDLSAGQYVHTMPGDIADNIPEILEIISVGASNFTARVRPFHY